ncbi:MBL fold metallo-hydrolase [Metabacillus sp. GX 13764]|uniref:MBL fold metallo-hydrolase n=1 Tax=Metabacillus kandeliae TaxID=2900151 RepID=UPI001E32F22A|nr:MBL fold metallo-hydrolase [Metabacillus kandeliae]MCD7035468.1 MBL fold metallo-hydrolase [Metabacillus kandeliae]
MEENKKLHDSISIIDSYDLQREGRTSTYVIRDQKNVLLEPSASPSVPHILKGLSKIGLSPEDIDLIIVTHIHLDHAGGAGLLLKSCPKAKVAVHPKGAKHLSNPSRLIAGAKLVYGSEFDELFDPVLPVPEERLLIMENGSTLSIGEDRELQFFDSPGHAAHHFSVRDTLTEGIFTGDTIGIFYQELAEHLPFYLPSTSPNQFDPEAMLQSARMIREKNPRAIYFSHFGASFSPDKALASLEEWLPEFLEAASRTLLKPASMEAEDKVQEVKGALFEKVSQYLKKHGVPDSHPVYDILELDLSVCSMGLIDYFSKRRS